MHSTTLISSALPKERRPALPEPPVLATCAVTGEETFCLQRKTVLGKSFTNQNVLACPTSEYVGIDVFYAWNYGYKTSPEKKREKKPERMACWFCDGTQFLELDKPNVRSLVLSPPISKQWAAYVTTSYKKHGSLFAPVNTGKTRIWLFETLLVDCSDTQKVTSWWERLRQAQDRGYGRTILETVICPPYLIAKYGVSTWLAFQAWATPKKTSTLYQFLCYLLLSRKELT